MSLEEFQKLQETTKYIRKQTSLVPKVGIVLGTGLSGVMEGVEQEASISYEDIPHFPVSTVESHLGNMLLGHLEGTPIAAFQGRFHYYEGYSPAEVVYSIRALKQLGAEYLIITNAAGGLNPSFKSSEIMLIMDHINLTGQNPLRGPNDSRLGPRFPGMTQPYDKELIKLADEAALQNGFKLRHGVYVGVTGPSLETAAETRMLRLLGADAVGMSTVFEVIAAVHMDMKVLGLATISNVNLPDAYEHCTIEEIIDNVHAAEPDLKNTIKGVVAKL